MALAPRAEPTTVPAPFVFTPSQDWDGNDGSWSTFNVNVGTPGQDFRVLISTSGYETWVVAPEGCTPTDPSDCATARGAEIFNSAASPGFETNQSSTWDMIGLYSLDLEKHLGYSGNGLFGYDRVGLGTYAETGGLVLNRTVVAGIADKDHFLGVLGLSTRPISFESTSDPIPSFFTDLKTKNLIPSSSYGYTAGASYRLKRVSGSLVLGGYDQSRFEPSNTTFTFSNDPTRDLTIGVQSIVAQDTLIGVASLTSTGHLSFIDSTVPHIWLPQAVCDVFERAFGLTYDPTTDLYLVNDTTHSQLQSLNPTISFKLGNQATIDPDGQSVTIDLPYAAFDLQASYPLYNTSTNYFPIRRAANNTQYTLGRTFLQEAYLTVDNERRNFSVSQAVFKDPMPSREIVTILCNGCTAASPDSSGLSTGATIGIAVGAVLLILGAGLAIFFFIRNKKRKQRLAELDDTQYTKVDAGPKPSATSSPAHDDENKPHEVDATQMRQELPDSSTSPAGYGPYKLSEKHGGLVQESLLSPSSAHELPAPLPSPAGHTPVIHELPGEYYVPIPGSGVGVSREVSGRSSPATPGVSPRWVEITEEEARSEGVSSPGSGGAVSPGTQGVSSLSPGTPRRWRGSGSGSGGEEGLK
ncbi:hypothetical protein W97_05479 [Coniosporium apollinis CBS 100218]|uniref:Peptidase A1 domain-containing protein n=1 Tax=Coniosporium apollinis (strain CBS 100218) TaxID=1168221 RepID=R7YWU7_CONA1|nr:uncharacterized protein W97_05479 [Coniosporium apollinis CBS 100218]EON66382.1 hypothetical protein W97_05479 [Coniosporium apollinis CBS 100218]